MNGLSRRLGPADGTSPHVEWNAPSGGFFVVVSLPFPADDELLEYSARRHRVLWTPMRYFFGDGGGDHQLRLSASLLTAGQIEVGLDRLAALIRDRADRTPDRQAVAKPG